MTDYGPEHFSLSTSSQCNKWPDENWSFFKQSSFIWICWNYVEICFGRENELEIWGTVFANIVSWPRDFQQSKPDQAFCQIVHYLTRARLEPEVRFWKGGRRSLLGLSRFRARLFEPEPQAWNFCIFLLCIVYLNSNNWLKTGIPSLLVTLNQQVF